MPQRSRNRAVAYGPAVLVLLAVGGRFLLDSGTARRGDARAASSSALVEVEPTAPRKLVVPLVGAGRPPRPYPLHQGNPAARGGGGGRRRGWKEGGEESRVAAAIELAGGSKPKAALELVNLAAPVADGQQIVVPARQERSGPSPPLSVEEPAASGPVHLNSATLEELDALPGVGPVTAQNILDYRTDHGGFRTLDELDAIPGIGPARLARLHEG